MSYLKMQIIRFETSQISRSALVYIFHLYLPVSQFSVHKKEVILSQRCCEDKGIVYEGVIYISGKHCRKTHMGNRSK